MIRIGILGAAEIAHRMFLPALKEWPELFCVGVAANDFDPSDKKKRFSDDFGVTIYDEPDSFLHLLEREDVDAVYLPLPPALHYEWAKRALEHGKHVFLEKPSTHRYVLTRDLVSLAAEKSLAIHENYMFSYHAQLTAIRDLLDAGTIGDLCSVRAAFGFPLRAQNDFRYRRELGGGALLDCGGYVVKLASLLLGPDLKLESATRGVRDGYEVDMFGSVHFSNSGGLSYQGAFGMDCHYQCSLELWGQTGKLTAGRIFTAPPGFSPPLFLETAEGRKELTLPSDNHFSKSIGEFLRAIEDKDRRSLLAEDMLRQAKLIDEIERYTGEGRRI